MPQNPVDHPAESIERLRTHGAERLTFKPTQYCEPDDERDGNPCVRCGKPGASGGVYGSRICTGGVRHG